MSSFRTFVNLDRALVSAGYPPSSEWWLEELARFYSSTARNHVARVGRGGAKSQQLVRLGMNEVLEGDFTIPPGERHYFAFVSVSKDEAGQRLRLLESYLTALGEPFNRAGDVIDLVDLPRGFRVFSCTIASVSGWRCLGAAGDEVAKWRTPDEAANPAKEVAASLRAMTVTHKRARMAFYSSPLSSSDWHSSLVDKGDTRAQVVSQAPTWIANPSITEEQTRELEPDDRTWRREYLAIPQAAELAAFDEEDVLRAFEPRGDVVRDHGRIVVIDASSGRKDAFTFGVVGWSELVSGGRALTFDLVDGFDAATMKAIGGDSAILRIANLAKERKGRFVAGDQREAMMIAAGFRRCGVRFVECTWTSATKPRAVARVRRWLREGMLALPQHDGLRRELLSFEERITPSGDFTFGARGSGHDDYVSLLLTAAMVDEERKLLGSPQRADYSEAERRWVGVSGPRELANLNAEPGGDHPIDRLQVDSLGRLVHGRRPSSSFDRGGF